MKGDIKAFLDLMSSTDIYPNKGNLDFYLRYLFEGIEFNNKSMLDIGGGSGMFTLFGGVMGLKKGICLEPQADGSTESKSTMFNDFSKQLDLDNVELIPIKIQDYQFSGKFDIIFLHNSVNHLDEPACINLINDNLAKEKYRIIFKHLEDFADTNSQIIIIDSSRFNFFQSLGIKNPIAPNIEWNKHHSPQIWANLLSENNFVSPEIRWNSPNSFRNIGRFFLGNKAFSYMTFSTFCLKMKYDKVD